MFYDRVGYGVLRKIEHQGEFRPSRKVTYIAASNRVLSCARETSNREQVLKDD
jgi:hypothetical protein